MPIYEYECNKCGKIIEAVQKFSDPPLINCDCHDGGKLNRLISKSAFHLKGSGWYVTDYAGKSQGSSDASKKSEESAKKDKKSETTSAE